MWDRGIATTKSVLRVAEWMFLRGWLREPDVTAVALQMPGLEGFSDIFFYDNSATGGVDEPGA